MASDNRQEAYVAIEEHAFFTAIAATDLHSFGVIKSVGVKLN